MTIIADSFVQNAKDLAYLESIATEKSAATVEKSVQNLKAERCVISARLSSMISIRKEGQDTLNLTSWKRTNALISIKLKLTC